MMKKKIVPVCLLFGICGLIYAFPPMAINDTGVRLRESPGLDGRIIRILAEGERVSMLSYRLNGNDEFRWIEVKTHTGDGWVYGEFVGLVEEHIPYRFDSIGDAALPVDKGVIEIGMDKGSLITLLGNPIRISVDEERNEEWLDFYYHGKLTVVVTRYNNRVSSFILHTPEQVLKNKVCAGLHIDTISKDNNVESDSRTLFFISPANYFRASEFDCSIILTVDGGGKIARIQIDGASR